MLIAAVDAAYSATCSTASCVVFDRWDTACAVSEHLIHCDGAAAYEPGAFYKRELPLLLDVLSKANVAPDVVVVDGYVWLNAARAPGLGAHLHAALHGACTVVGIAKTAFADADAWAIKVVRGSATRPLYVTAIGMPEAEAANNVRRMHGQHRIPTLIRRVDRLAREALT